MDAPQYRPQRIAEIEIQRLVRDAADAGIDTGLVALALALASLAECHATIRQTHDLLEADALVLRVCRKARTMILDHHHGTHVR
jgi:hypothetical protein